MNDPAFNVTSSASFSHVWKVSAIGASAALLFLFTGCAYTQTFVKQAYYRAQVRHTPTPAIYKHMLNRPTYFVFGKVSIGEDLGSLAVVAVSTNTAQKTVVDVSHAVRSTSYYGLNLPPGDYRLVVVRDSNRDALYRESEVVGERRLSISPTAYPEKVIAGIDIDNITESVAPLPAHWSVPVRHIPTQLESVVFPRGTLRTLDDPLFRKEIATLGLYEPSAFMEIAPLMFYAAKENASHKVPVIFVHGIGGSPRDFATIVERLDRRRYQPWFFYYPSGASLAQLSHLFYEIFLSGRTILAAGPVVIVAHSMGGLVAREALNRYGSGKGETEVGAFITIASPLGGHPKAHLARRAPVVLPSWRDLDPAGTFIRDLHRKPLPSAFPHYLYYAFGHSEAGRESDGVVPLSSQRTERADREAAETFGYKAGHVEILQRDDAVDHIVGTIETVKSAFPEDHLRVLDEGGYDLVLGPEFSRLETHIIRSTGRYLDALVSGELNPFHPELQTFVDACRGKTTSRHPAVTAWLKLHRAYPQRASSLRV